jgi:hypothetical protein
MSGAVVLFVLLHRAISGTHLYPFLLIFHVR